MESFMTGAEMVDTIAERDFPPLPGPPPMGPSVFAVGHGTNLPPWQTAKRKGGHSHKGGRNKHHRGGPTSAPGEIPAPPGFRSSRPPSTPHTGPVPTEDDYPAPLRLMAIYAKGGASRTNYDECKAFWLATKNAKGKSACVFCETHTCGGIRKCAAVKNKYEVAELLDRRLAVKASFAGA